MKKILISISVLLNILVLAGVGFIWSIKDDLMNGMIWAHAERLRTQFDLFTNRTAEIVITGDSLVEGGRWQELFPEADILNRGISGDTTTDLLGRFDQIIKLAPNKLFIMIGINDLNRNIDRSTTFANYETLFNTIDEKLPETTVYILSVLPVGESWMFADNSLVPAMNAELVRHTENRGYTYIDLHTTFANSNGFLNSELTNDGIHLLGKGYQLWQSELSGYLTRAVN